MSNKTKRNVFEELLDAYDDAKSSDGNLHPTQELLDYDDRYANALPDDLPVIPKEVSDRLKQAKADKSSLRYMFACSSINMLSDWWMAKNTKNEDVFARAWLLGVWRVEETGEVVKL